LVSVSQCIKANNSDSGVIKTSGYRTGRHIVDSISKHCGISYEKIMEQVPDEELNQQLRELNIDLKVNANNQDKAKNSGTAKGVFEVLYHLLNGGILDDCPKQWIMEGLRLQNDVDGFRFRKDNNWNHMTGGLDGVCNDVGYVEFGTRKIIVIGLLETKDPNVEWYQLEATMQKIGEHIMIAFEGVFK
jgi:hypothetical protein